MIARSLKSTAEDYRRLQMTTDDYRWLPTTNDRNQWQSLDYHLTITQISDSYMAQTLDSLYLRIASNLVVKCVAKNDSHFDIINIQTFQTFKAFQSKALNKYFHSIFNTNNCRQRHETSNTWTVEWSESDVESSRWPHWPSHDITRRGHLNCDPLFLTSDHLSSLVLTFPLVTTIRNSRLESIASAALEPRIHWSHDSLIASLFRLTFLCTYSASVSDILHSLRCTP